MELVDQYKFHVLTEDEYICMGIRGMKMNMTHIFINKMANSIFDKNYNDILFLFGNDEKYNIISTTARWIYGSLNDIDMYEKYDNYVVCKYDVDADKITYRDDECAGNSLNNLKPFLHTKISYFHHLIFNIRQICFNNDICEDVTKYILTLI